MRKFGLLGTSAFCSAAFITLSMAAATPALAQSELDPDENTEAQPQGETEIESGDAATADAAADNDTIVVTGSRIRRPNLTSTVPITSVGPEEVLSTADVSLGDALNDLPSLRSSFSQSNSTRFIGTAGLNWLDLRGLGVSRTLTLVNGRRHVTSTPGDYIVDVNTIPSDLVDRIDVVTGGNSSIYGSDAVAGVVNFILKRNFDGIRVRGQGSITDNGDRGSYFGSITAGRNFADDRGNIAISLEYAKANPLYFRDRPFEFGSESGRCQFNLAEPTVGEPAAGDNIPDQQFFCGVKNANISTGGIVTANASTNPASPVFCGTLPEPIRSQRCFPNGQPRLFAFGNGGQLLASTPVLDFRPFGSGNFVGGLGSSLRETGQVAAGLQRYMGNLLFSFEVSPAFRPFVEAKYVHVDAVQEGQPSFFQGGLLGTFSCSNPFLTPEALATMQSVGRCLNPAGTFAVNRFNTDFGGRGELHDRDTYRVVAGVGGDFNDDWRYEVSFNYGHLKTHMRSLNNLLLTDITGNNFAGYLLAYDAVRDANGNIVCGVNADADPDNNDPACVPIDLFGTGGPSQAALDYVNTTALRDERASEYVASAYVSGDFSQLFELPGGAIGFALGAEWRRETAFSAYDPLTAAGATFLNAIADFDPPAFEVKEVFGEMRIPLLKDMPFAHELTIEAAGRLSDYKGATGTVFAYNIGGTWSPMSDLRFRANYSKSVRAPTQSDLYSPFSQNFAFIQDPCDVLFINLGPNRLENCRADGVPVDQPGGFQNTPARSQSTGFLSGGNINLIEETGKSLTIGGVYTPSFLPGFSISVDWYRINVENLIAVLGAQQIISTCYDQPTLDNQFCTSVSRDPATGFFNDVAVLSSGVNFAAQKTEGVDVDIAYRHNFENGHKLNIRGIATYVIRLDNFTDPVSPDFADRQLSELGDPRLAANLNVGYEWGPYELSYSLHYIGKQVIATIANGGYEAQHPFDGNPPTNADLTAEVWYPDVFYHNIRMGIKVNDRFTFYGGIDNLTDRAPPFGLTGTGDGDPYDPIGRQFYFGATVDF